MAMLSQPITVYHYPLSVIAAYRHLSPTKYLLPPYFLMSPYNRLSRKEVGKLS